MLLAHELGGGEFVYMVIEDTSQWTMGNLVSDFLGSFIQNNLQQSLKSFCLRYISFFMSPLSFLNGAKSQGAAFNNIASRLPSSI